MEVSTSKKHRALKIRVPSLQIDLVDDEEPVEDQAERLKALRTQLTSSRSFNSSLLRPPSSIHTLPRRGIIILSPDTTPKRYVVEYKELSSFLNIDSSKMNRNWRI